MAKTIALALVIALAAALLSGCASAPQETPGNSGAEEAARAPLTMTVVNNEPDTVDFQCTTIYYTIALNVFNRLVEMQSDGNGNVEFIPALASSWEISEDGLNYTFHLREGVTFSNGSPLTASDVLYTFNRLLTYPVSCNQDIAQNILGADRLQMGESESLEGFRALSDLDFVITLDSPFPAFLACLAMPAASILDEESTEAAGDRFGLDAASTVGTGSFILSAWESGKGMTLTANPTCWEGMPAYDVLNLVFSRDGEMERRMFENGELDILDLDQLGVSAEYFIHGDIYRDRLLEARQIGISYIALNESIAPLDDARVRKALQLAVDRQTLLDAIYSGRGVLENGIFPTGLLGHNPDLPEIPFDPEAAKALLAEAGLSNGFDLNISVKASSTQQEKKTMTMVASMWEKIGVRASVDILEESEFMRYRKSGALACYTASWNADYNDPDNFIYTFFGSIENTVYRSLCYTNGEIMRRVRQARSITDEAARIREYQDLERTIVQQDAAWVPLYSRTHYFVMGERIKDYSMAWNGWISPRYRYYTLGGQDAQGR